MADSTIQKPYKPIIFELKNFQFNTTIAPGGSWYGVNCAVSGKKLIGIGGFGVDYPGKVYITNISIQYAGTVSLFIVNNNSTNSSGFNFTGLYVDSSYVP